jgi:hypothetical protein
MMRNVELGICVLRCGEVLQEKFQCLKTFFESIHDFVGMRSVAIFLLLLSHADLGQTRSFAAHGAALQHSIVAFQALIFARNPTRKLSPYPSLLTLARPPWPP